MSPNVGKRCFFSLSVKSDHLKIRFAKFEGLLDLYTFISVDFLTSRLHDAFHKLFNLCKFILNPG